MNPGTFACTNRPSPSAVPCFFVSRGKAANSRFQSTGKAGLIAASESGPREMRRASKTAIFLGLLVTLAIFLPLFLEIPRDRPAEQAELKLEIEKAIISNFMNQAMLIKMVETLKPMSDEEEGKPSPEVQMQNAKARVTYRDLLKSIAAQISESPAIKDPRSRMTLGAPVFDTPYLSRVDQIFGHLEQSRSEMVEMHQGMKALLEAVSQDSSLVDQGRVIHATRLRNAKAELAMAASIFCLIVDRNLELGALNSHFEIAGFDFRVEPGWYGSNKAHQYAQRVRAGEAALD